jgi:hypothetical protein
MRLEQAENIKDHIAVVKVKAGDLILEGNADTGPCVTLELRIRNESLFNISIQPDDVKGCLAFADRPLPEPISVIIDFAREPITNLRPFGWASLVLCQPLRIVDVERIISLQDNSIGRFSLAPLVVPITIDSQYKVPSKNLRIAPDIEHLPINAFRVTKTLDNKD